MIAFAHVLLGMGMALVGVGFMGVIGGGE